MTAGASPKTYEILIAHGVNLDLLGRREPEIYGTATLADINQRLQQKANQLEQSHGCRIQLTFMQTNHETVYLETLSTGFSGAVLNPGAWTHTSLALGDRLAGLGLPYVEVHLSDPKKREAFRSHSFLAEKALKVVSGLGAESYVVGFETLMDYLLRQS